MREKMNVSIHNTTNSKISDDQVISLDLLVMTQLSPLTRSINLAVESVATDWIFS